jgi:hypothetical protein
VQEPGRYPFRDGFITVLEMEIAIWRSHPNELFNLMRKNPIRGQIELRSWETRIAERRRGLMVIKPSPRSIGNLPIKRAFRADQISACI